MLTYEQKAMRALLDKRPHKCTLEEQGYYKHFKWTDKKGNTSLSKKKDSELAVKMYKELHINTPKPLTYNEMQAAR